MLRAIAVCLFLIGRCAVAQVKPPLPEFDAGVVKLNKSGANEASGGILPGGEFSVRNISMIDLLQFAWHVNDNAISGSQPWFRSDRFDVIGKAPANTPDAKLRLMLQSLLAREFKLKVHEEQKPQDAFALVVAKGGPTLQKSAGPAAAMWWRLNFRMRRERARRAQMPLIWMARILYLAITLLAVVLATLMTQISGPVVTIGFLAFGVLAVPAALALWGWSRSQT